MTPLHNSTSQQASPSSRLHPPSQGISPPFPTDCSEICRTRRAAATAQRRCRFSASVALPESKNPAKNAATLRRREETAANPPVLCSPSCKSKCSLSFTPTGRQLTSSAPPPRSSSHMSVVQGPEGVVYALLWVSPISTCRWAAEFIHGIPNLKACDGSPVVVSASCCPLGSTRQDFDRPGKRVTTVLACCCRFTLRKAIAVYRSRLHCSGVANATPKTPLWS
jgi:hypothetical protein